MNLLVWVMMGIAIWHFAVFVPDRFWGGIVGAFGAALVGAVVIGLVAASPAATSTTRPRDRAGGVPGRAARPRRSYFGSGAPRKRGCPLSLASYAKRSRPRRFRPAAVVAFRRPVPSARVLASRGDPSRRWHAASLLVRAAHALSRRELGLSRHPLVLVRRGFGEPAAARRFLEATESHDPFAFARHAGGRRSDARPRARAAAAIAVHGDYDVDGVCSTALAGARAARARRRGAPASAEPHGGWLRPLAARRSSSCTRGARRCS